MLYKWNKYVFGPFSNVLQTRDAAHSAPSFGDRKTYQMDPANGKEAVRECEKGLTFGAPTEKEFILAELVQEIMPSMEMMRLVNSGTEAVISAIRAAGGGF